MPEEEMTEFERQRAANIAKNMAILAGLGIERNATPKQPKKRVKVKKDPSQPATEGIRKSTRVTNVPKRRYAEKRQYAQDGDEQDNQTKKKKRRRYKDNDFSDENESEESDADFYSDDSQSPGPARRRKYPPDYDGILLPGDGDGLRRRVVNGRNVQHIDPKKWAARADPKVFGPIAGFKVGHWWPTRIACSADAVHPPTVGGIYGGSTTGAYSVSVSGGYEDDVDEGFRFTFTGSGGRDLKGTAKNPKNLRTAPQSSDQTLTGFNLALKVSCETGNPVRVIRGYKAALGPKEGYRYDGLYQVLKAWQETGLSGFKVWKFAFKRIDGQAPLDTSIGPPTDCGDESDLESESEDGDEEEVEDNKVTTTKAKKGVKAADPKHEESEAEAEPKAETKQKRTRRSTRKSYREPSLDDAEAAPSTSPSTHEDEEEEEEEEEETPEETPITSDESDIKQQQTKKKMTALVVIPISSKESRGKVAVKDENQSSVKDFFSPEGEKVDKKTEDASGNGTRSSRRASGRGV